MTQWWNTPITVETRKTGDRLTISNTERASEYLLGEWPTLEDGEAYKAAKQALSDAHDGKIEAEKARDAFLAALKEGDVYVFEE